MSILHPGTPVYVRDLSRHGLVTAQHHNPRSFIIQTDQGQLRRNRSHLIETPTAVTSDDSIKHTPQRSNLHQTEPMAMKLLQLSGTQH